MLLVWRRLAKGLCSAGGRGVSGHLPSVNISQRRIPKDHTSLRVVYRLLKMLSGAIHFKGKKVCEENTKWEWVWAAGQ